MIKKNIIFSTIISFLIGGFVVGAIIFIPTLGTKHNTIKYNIEYNKKIIAEQEEGILNLISAGKYKCCLAKPCSYCFSNPEDQDKELVCDCLKEVMNGEHPCGECIGEILEGNGNPLISEYFATAIAEKVGKNHLSTLKQIIADKYDMPIDRQI